jgi:hypothetical protein
MLIQSSGQHEDLLQIRKTAAQNAKTALAMKSGMQIFAGRSSAFAVERISLRWFENKSLLDQIFCVGSKVFCEQCAVSPGHVLPVFFARDVSCVRRRPHFARQILVHPCSSAVRVWG